MLNKNIGLLIMRVGLGGIFMAHGIMKIQSMDQIIGFFGKLGFSPILAWTVAIIEIVGGALIILGLFTYVAGILLAITMLVALVKVKLPMGHGIMSGELEFALLTFSLGLGLMGPGKFALVSMCKCGKCMMCQERKAAGTCGAECNHQGGCCTTGTCNADCKCDCDCKK